MSRHQITVDGATYHYTVTPSARGTLVIRAPGVATFEAADLRQARARLKMAYQGK